MMKLTSMRSRASFVLFAVALAQLVVLGAALGFLTLKLHGIRADLARAGQDEQSFLNQLADAESNLYRSSILLRDDIILAGPEQERARLALVELFARMSDQPLPGPAWLPAPLESRLRTVEAERREYVARAKTVVEWSERDRKLLGPQYLAQQVAPMRERFLSTAKEIAALVQSLLESRNREMAASVDRIQALLVQIVAVAAGLGLALTVAATWRFRHYERERDEHIRHLDEAGDSLRTLSQRLVESQELERKNLSRELHDEIGQILTALRVQLGQIEVATESSAGHLERASELAERSLRSVREMARGLRPAMLDDLGLAPALKWLGRDFSRNSAIDVQLRIEGEMTGLDETRRTCLYRVVQEALTNCARHSGSGSATVTLQEHPGEIVLTVQDNGRGFHRSAGKGVGLLGMRERVEELRGDFTVISSPGRGTLIRVNLPKAEATQI